MFPAREFFMPNLGVAGPIIEYVTVGRIAPEQAGA
jgi:hypothetical protein